MTMSETSISAVDINVDIGCRLSKFDRTVLRTALACLTLGDLTESESKDLDLYQLLTEVGKHRGYGLAVNVANIIAKKFAMPVDELETLVTKAGATDFYQQLPKEWPGINVRLQLIQFLLSLGDHEHAMMAILLFSKRHLNGESIHMCPIEFVDDICRRKDCVTNDDLSKIKDVAKYFHSSFFTQGNPADNMLEVNIEVSEVHVQRQVATGYRNSDMKNFMVNPLSEPSNRMKKNVDNLNSGHSIFWWKRNFKMISLIILIVFCFLCLTIPSVLLGISNMDTSSSSENGTTVAIEDVSYLISHDPSATSITITLFPMTPPVHADVYKSSNIPQQITDHLPQIAFQKRSGQTDGSPFNRFNYNYLTSDIPISLQPGSSINYHLLATNSSNTMITSIATDSSSLYIFDNRQSYDDFRNDKTSEALAQAICFPQIKRGEESVCSFHINQSASYYVVLQVERNLIISGNATVERTTYNASSPGLQKECELITTTRLSCNITLCTQFFGCTDGGYLLVNATAGTTRLSYQYRHAKFGAVEKIIFIVLLLILVLLLVPCVCGVLFSLSCKQQSTNALQRNNEINNK